MPSIINTPITMQKTILQNVEATHLLIDDIHIQPSKEIIRIKYFVGITIDGNPVYDEGLTHLIRNIYLDGAKVGTDYDDFVAANTDIYSGIKSSVYQKIADDVLNTEITIT